MNKVGLDKISLSFPAGAGRTIKIFTDLSLDLEGNSLVALVGPNGCGKTTLLNIIAGLQRPDSGEVLIDSDLRARLGLGYVFQDYASSLLPWKTARENIALPYSLKAGRRRGAERRNNLVKKLGEFDRILPLNRYPYQLSSGQRQMVCVLRTLLYTPELVLLDEPFSSLDPSNRQTMHNLLLDFFREAQPTILLVSHTLDEALFLADRIIVLSPRPASVSVDTHIPFPRPRKPSLLSTREFVEFRQGIVSKTGATVL